MKAVRPLVRRIAIVTFALLLPVALYQLWDYWEVRRLVREIEAIRDKGEPVTDREPSAQLESLLNTRNEAERYYLAGAMLALSSAAPAGVVERLGKSAAESTDLSGTDRQALAALRQFVEGPRNVRALALADAAAALPFSTFPSGTEYSYRVSGLVSLFRLIAARTLDLSISKRADEAVHSAISGIQARRALRDVHAWSIEDRQVESILSHSRPTQEPLRELQAVLAEQEQFELPLTIALRERARYIELIWTRYGYDSSAPRPIRSPRGPLEAIARPLLAHRSVEALREWARLVNAATANGPRGIYSDAALAAKTREASSDDSMRGLPFTVVGRAMRAKQLMIDRSSIAAVAVERYRADNGGLLPKALGELVPKYITDVPIDIFSGAALSYRVGPQSYTIYSIGEDLKDNDGDTSLQPNTDPVVGKAGVSAPADTGIRVLTHR